MAGPQSLEDRLSEHISVVKDLPSTPLDVRLFDEAELTLPPTLQRSDRVAFTRQLAELLPNLQQDPTPAVNLLLRLIDDLSYSDVLSFGNLPFTDGLVPGEHMVSFNRLILSLLEKATKSPVDAAQVASMLDTMLALVRLWLCTSDTGTASQASRLLLDLLRIDREHHSDPESLVPDGGQGLVWKRVFGDRDVYGTLFEACTLSGPSSLVLSKSQRTLAQARLMEWLPAVGQMDWSAIARSHHPDIEAAYEVKEGILEFAALKMVDHKNDVLMHRCLIDFYSDLLQTVKSAGLATIPAESPALKYLVAHGIHARTAGIYLQQPGTRVDPVEAMFLYGPAANYIATYSSSFPDDFLASNMRSHVNSHLLLAFDQSPAKWAHGESPKHDLHLVASLPRESLLPSADGNASWSLTPLSLLPSKSSNPDVLNTLAAIFHGPVRHFETFPAKSAADQIDPRRQSETSAARALYFHYLARNPHFWRDIAVHADTIALKELALAAINCLISVITAEWSPVPDLTLPTTIATPDSGALAILSPPSLEYSLPFLLKPPQTFANLVGGRGDSEGAAYKIATAKYDALRALHGKLLNLVEQQPGIGYEEILVTLSKRLNDGPLSKEGEVGGTVGTLEL